MKPKTLIARPLNLSLSDRRVVLLGAGASLLLAACGGGGESKAKSLREAYDLIGPGMYIEDVTELVGFGPYSTGEDTWWNVGNEFLRAQRFNPLVSGETGPDRFRIRRVFYQTSTMSLVKDLP